MIQRRHSLHKGRNDGYCRPSQSFSHNSSHFRNVGTTIRISDSQERASGSSGWVEFLPLDITASASDGPSMRTRKHHLLLCYQEEGGMRWMAFSREHTSFTTLSEPGLWVRLWTEPCYCVYGSDFFSLPAGLSVFGQYTSPAGVTTIKGLCVPVPRCQRLSICVSPKFIC